MKKIMQLFISSLLVFSFVACRADTENYRIKQITFVPVELMGQRVGHIDAPDTEYFNPEAYDQPDWDYIYALPFVSYFYAASP